MKYEDWDYLASVFLILGILLLIVGLVAFGNSDYIPKDYTFPLILLSVVLFVIGGATMFRVEQEKKLAQENSITEIRIDQA